MRFVWKSCLSIRATHQQSDSGYAKDNRTRGKMRNIGSIRSPPIALVLLAKSATSYARIGLKRVCLRQPAGDSQTR